MSAINVETKKDSMNLASCSKHDPIDEKNTPTIRLRLKCPGSIVDDCEKTELVWHCEKCKKPINHDAENYFHCACGRSKSENFVFKCSSVKHGPEFIAFPPGLMNKLLKEIPELNILVFGVSNYTSRWINSFVNLIAFPSLEEATKRNLIETSPLTFHIIDKNNELQEVTFGDSKIERGNICVKVLGMGTMLMRVISVPGLGECRERENVIKYFLKLLSYLRNLKHLHGVCILPNDTPIFQLCFEEFLNHFDYKVMRNVVFGFEHLCNREMTRNFAEARVYLSNYLSRNRSYVALDENRMYSIDAECFTFVCAVKQGVKNIDDDTEISKMWESSVKESKRLFSYFKIIHPHILHHTLTLIDAKINVIKLSKPIADVMDYINRQIVEVLNQATSKQQKAIDISYPSELNIQPLPNLQTVCTNSKCINKFQSESFPVCHENCCVDDVTLAVPFDPRLKDCLAMSSGESLCCEMCNCCWAEHMQISYIKIRKFPGSYVSINGANVYSNNVRPFIQELEKEQQKLIEITAKIGRYLSKCSLISFSTKVIQYLQNYIKSEEKDDVEKRSDEFIDRLTFARNAYFVEDKNLMKKVNEKELDELEYEKLLNELFTLKRSGKKLKQMIDATSNALRNQIGEVKVCDEFYDLLKE